MPRRTGSTDPRAVRTRTSLIEASIKLLAEGRSEELSVSQIVEHARVSRQVFYEHFESREELLTAVGDQVLVEPIARYAQGLADNYGDENNVLELAKEVGPRRRVVLNLIHGPADSAIYGRCRDALLPVTLELLDDQLGPPGQEIPADDMKWSAEFLIAGLLGILAEALRSATGPAEAARRVKAVARTVETLRLSRRNAETEE